MSGMPKLPPVPGAGIGYSAPALNRRSLPIFELEHRVVASLQSNPRLILQAPTGSGKSTQIPQILLDHGLLGTGECIVLQPRRLATRMLASRVAQERSCRLGGEVGYQIRLDQVASAETRIRFVTEGVLLRKMLSDPTLDGIQALVFDEFHERHLYGDITLAKALELQQQLRPDLLLVVMSATLETAVLQRYMAPCEVLTSEGRSHPVHIEYLERSRQDAPVWETATEELERLAPSTEGDVLVFMPGAFEIQRTLQAMEHSRVARLFRFFPLHGELSPAQQDAAVAPCNSRKVIVSTNVAETSLTIAGVRLVIDAGLAKIARFDPYRGINTLLVEKISRAASDQRAGRAGRTAPGHCLRLWTEREHQDRAPQELPEIRRLDLSEVVLTLKASGVEDIRQFRWLEPPDARALERAQTLLEDLGALHPDTSAITPLGRRMLAFPTHPRHARMLLAAEKLGCVPEAALLAALTQGRAVLRRPENSQMEQDRDRQLGEVADSDFELLLRAHRYAEESQFNPQRCRTLGIHALAAREAAALADQLLRIARDEGLSTRSNSDPEALAKCILAGFPDHVALRADSGTLRCQLVHQRRGLLARESTVRSPLLVACEIREVQVKGELETLLSLALAIREEWLREIYPEAFHSETRVAYDPSIRRVTARKLTRFRDLILRSENSEQIPLEDAAALLAKEVAAGSCPLKNWDHSVEQWILRLNSLADWCPEFELPKLGEADRQVLVEQICHGALGYKELKERPVWPVVKSWLSAGQQDLLERFAPERIALPSGRMFKLTYQAGTPPTLAARIQDLYGVESELRIANGRVPLVIQVLAPSHRPIQITQNLATFWRDSYPKIRQELQRKYPRHEWR
ncbi:MAG: ATP-dependent helicase HrpB [Verrucomicrobiota bacterium]